MSSTTSRRAILAGAAMLPVASLPALAVPAFASEAIGPDHPDAELLRLGAQLDSVGRESAAKCAIDARRRAAWEAACVSVGLPRIEFGSIPDDEFRAYSDKRSKVRSATELDEADEDVDEHGCSVAWNRIRDQLYKLIDEILPRKAVTAAGLAVQTRAVVLAAFELWYDEENDDNEHERLFIEAACAFVGTTPARILAGQAGEAVQS
jgi:hypothetical protein